MPRAKTPKPKQFRVNWKGKFEQLQQEHLWALYDRAWMLGELREVGYDVSNAALGKVHCVVKPPKPWYWGWWPW